MFQGKRWEFVRSNIEEAIASRRFRPGEKLPNDLELALKYGVNRHTVRYAIRALEQEGLLRVEQGRGTFVVEHPTPYLLSPQTRLTDNLISQGRLARRKILSAATIPADERLAGYLDLQARDDVLRIDTLSYQDEIPIVIAHSYFPAKRTPGLLDKFSGANSISTALKRIGIDDYSQQWVTISARLPSAQEARLLAMSTSAPVFVKESLDCSGRVPIKFGENVLCAPRISFRFDFEEIGSVAQSRTGKPQSGKAQPNKSKSSASLKV
ncbi:phosphonate metabolism transcriptional regulator PhnF [Bradyrhizobium barranii subsp. barranii]|uniref:Phosphonate metabolism transcriptional regulator PhnF n=1 Tax=Bradyrhizobium barranii subsp. barranii TaxID=2823807 RepID=A0A7Z0TTB6_9BRAD|nr:phosphonate metabolism transcriptional regulator PhnF [Bradyrhizobium barranii]UGX92623.1 phosphonate metabolism transcriptional regulator PhnF [Bradyrhizobium barranii subsp. barranii]